MRTKFTTTAAALSAATVLLAEGQDKLSSIHSLKFENGELLQADTSSNAVFIDPDGREYKNLPPGLW